MGFCKAHRFNSRIFFALACIVFLAACVSQKDEKKIEKPSPKASPTAVSSPIPTATPFVPEEGFYKVPWEKLQGAVDDGDLKSLAQGIDASLKWTRSQSPDREVSFGKQKIPLKKIVETLSAVQQKLALNPSADDFQNFLKTEFDVWQAVPAGGKDFLATGYYIPKIQGSAFPTAEFRVPVFGIPTDLLTISLGDFDESLKGRNIRGRVKGNAFVPYFEREQIRSDRSLVGRAEVLTWVRSEWDAFLIEVQGSGILVEGNAEYLLSYADQNGRSYRPVGKLLLQENKISKEKMSMQAIGKYLDENPNEVRRVLDFNPSFVFFQKEMGNAKGSLGVELTPGRSVAVDYSRFPQAALAFVHIHDPVVDAKGVVGSAGKISRFVVNQDTGGAIRGQGRMDFFWGAGPEAFEKAGAMQHGGDYYLVLKR